MRGPKFKLIHKPTGLTFGQKAMKVNGGILGVDEKWPTYLLDSGYPAYYCGKGYYPYMSILPISEWDVIVKAKPHEE